MTNNDYKIVIVTGGAGYVGAPLVSLLLQNNFNVIVIDKLTFSGESLLSVWHHPNFRLFEIDIVESKKVEEILKQNKIDAVVHLAAIVGDPACAKQPELAKKINDIASNNLLDLALTHNVERFIFASTCSNYGKMSDPSSYVREDSPLAPVSLYAELKVKFEKTLMANSPGNDVFCPTALRFATVYGISPRMRFDLTVNEFAKELALGRELEVFGEQFWRPYCHVYDFSRAILLVLNAEKKKVSHRVFNVGSTEENYTKQMIVEEIKKRLPDARVKFIQRDEDPRDYRVSFEKIRRELGFEITRKVPNGITEVIESIINKVFLNPDDPKYRNV